MNDKARAADYAAQQITEGATVGLGTGSTASLFIQALAARVREGLRVTAVASSLASARLAEEEGLSLRALEHTARLDWYVDGADEVTPQKTLLKGRGYDLVREKLLARAASRFLVLIESTKRVEALGSRFPVPVEVLPFAWKMVRRALDDAGALTVLRQNVANDGPAITSQGNLVLDATFAPGQAPERLDALLSGLPGVAAHGIFLEVNHTIVEGSAGAVQVW